MKQKIKPIEKAIQYLKNNIQNLNWKNGTKLPTAKEMAKEAVVGISSMVQALAVLKKEKLLVSKQKSGTFVGEDFPLQKKTNEKKTKLKKYEIIKGHIKKEIQNGKFHNYEFIPSIKELMALYETSFRIIKQAIIALTDENLLAPSKRSFRINIFKPHAVFKEIVFITGKAIFSLLYWSYERSRFETFLRTLEKECSIRNIRLFKHHYAPDENVLENKSNILGYIIWFRWDMLWAGVDHFIEYLHVLLHERKCVTLMNLNIDHASSLSFQLRNLCIKYNNLFIFNYSHDKIAGYRLGRFFISKGYTKACYFFYLSQYKDDVWPRERHEGLQKAFSEAGFPDAVHLFAADNNVDPIFLQSGKNQKKSIPVESGLLDKGIAYLKKLTLPTRDFEDRLVNQIHEFKYGLDLHRIFSPFFQEALSMKGIKAWVCANDYLANAAAFEFLKAEKIRIPQHVGLAGFDDQIESLINSLTTYHFDYSKAAITMINVILYPQSVKKSKTYPDVLGLDGIVIDRGSV